MAMNNARQIERIDPAAGIPGGEVAVECAPESVNNTPPLSVWFQDQPAHVVAATPDRALVLVPELIEGATIEVSAGAERLANGKPAPFVIAEKLAGDIH